MGIRSKAFAAVLILVAVTLPGVSAGAAEPGTFSDDDGNVHEGFIEAIAAEGITRGCIPPMNGRYCPGDSVTRGQMAAFLTRALELPAATTDFFVDDDGSGPRHRRWVVRCCMRSKPLSHA